MRPILLSIAAAGLLAAAGPARGDDWKDESGQGRGWGGPPPWAGGGGETPWFARGQGYWDGHFKHGRGGFPGGHNPGGFPGHGQGGYYGQASYQGYGQGGYYNQPGYGGPYIQPSYQGYGQGGYYGQGDAPYGGSYPPPAGVSGGQLDFGGTVNWQLRRYHYPGSW